MWNKDERKALDLASGRTRCEDGRGARGLVQCKLARTSRSGGSLGRAGQDGAWSWEIPAGVIRVQPLESQRLCRGGDCAAGKVAMDTIPLKPTLGTPWESQRGNIVG